MMSQELQPNYDPKADGEKNALRKIAPDVLCGCGNCANHAREIALQAEIRVPDKTQAREILGITPAQQVVIFPTQSGEGIAFSPTELANLGFLKWQIDERRLAGDTHPEPIEHKEAGT